MLLIFADQAERAKIGTESASLQVVWIERDDAPDKASEIPASSGAADRETRPEVTGLKAQVSAEQGYAGIDEVGESVEQSQLDLSLPTATMEFRHGVLERPERMERESVIQVVFQDRSLGGTLQRMTHRGICGELSRALMSQPESYEAIERSMVRHNCKVQN
ncbi:hypothetical protein [Luteimonas sp. A501]